MDDNLFTPSAQNALLLAQQAAKRGKHGVIGTEHILLGLASETNGIPFKAIQQFSITADDIRGVILQLTGYGTMSPLDANAALPYSPKSKQVLARAQAFAKHQAALKVGTEHLLLALLSDKLLLSSRVLLSLGVKPQNLKTVVLRKMGYNAVSNQDFKLNRERSQSHVSGTPVLDKYAVDLTEKARHKKMDPLIGRHKEIKQVVQVLSRRTKNNPVLLGNPGVGKTAIAEGLAQKMVNHEVPARLSKERLMSINMGTLVAGTKFRGEFEQRLRKIIKEIKKQGNIILFIDELQTLVGAGGAEGAIDASNILKPSLARGDLQLMGATTIAEYRKYIEKDSALERRFSTVDVPEPTKEQTFKILQGLRPKYEEFHQVKIPDQALHTAIRLSTRYIQDRFLPDKAIDLIDEGAAKLRVDNLSKAPQSKTRKQYLAVAKKEAAAINQQHFEAAAKLRLEKLGLKSELKDEAQAVAKKQQKQHFKLKETPNLIAQIVSEWTKVPVTRLTKSEEDRLIHLESILHKRIIGQDEAVSAVSRSIRRARSGIKDPNRPIGSFMFLGPTGVGKTALAKELAKTVFGSEKDLIRIDMGEYQAQESASRLIGSDPGYVGYESGGQLTSKVRTHPYSVVLFDEVEKANTKVFNVILQLLDDGYLTDAKGRKVDFRNTIIIMTSNLGATVLRDQKPIGFDKKQTTNSYHNMSQVIKQSLKEHFRPEFLNRIDDVIIFHALKKPQIRKIVKIMTKELLKRVIDKGIDIKMTPAAVDVIANAGFNPEYGARPIRRALQNKIEDPLSEELLLKHFKAGDTVMIGARRGKIRFTKKASNGSKTPVKIG